MPVQVRLDDDVAAALDAPGSLSKATNLALRAHLGLPAKVKRKRRSPRADATDATPAPRVPDAHTPIGAAAVPNVQVSEVPQRMTPARRVARVPDVRGTGVRVARRSR